MADTGLVDQYGRPLKSSQVIGDVAAPTYSSRRSPLSEHPGDNLTPGKLARILKASADGDVADIFSLAEDIEEREPHYLTVLNVRKRNISKLQTIVEAASDSPEHKKHADFINAWLRKGILKTALFDILDAIGKGYSITEIDWQMMGDALLPARLSARPQRWFALAELDRETLVIKTDDIETPLLPHKFIIHKHPVKTGLTIRSALIRPITWCWMYKSYTQRDWALFVQNYGMPIRIGRFDAAATEEDKNTLWRAVRNVAGDMAAIIPASMNLEFVELKQGDKSSVLYQQRVDWFDRQVSKVVLGQTTTTDAVSGGHAVSQEHYKVLEDIEQADAETMAATLNSQLIPNIIAFNFGQQDDYPIIRLARDDTMDIGTIVNAVKELGPMGLTVEASWLRDKLGASAPAADAEIVGGRPLPAQIPEQGGKSQNTRPPVPQEAGSGAGATGKLNNLFGRRSNAMNSRQTRDETDALIERLQKRVEDDTAGAMAGLTEAVREVFTKAESLHEAAERLAEMRLSPAELSNAMARGMALANLAGQATFLDDLQSQK